jgi:hypothetical protein
MTMAMTPRFSPLLVAVLCVLVGTSWNQHKLMVGVNAFAGQPFQSVATPFSCRYRSPSPIPSPSTATTTKTKTAPNTNIHTRSGRRRPTSASASASATSLHNALFDAAVDPTTVYVSSTTGAGSAMSTVLLSATTLDPTTFFQNFLSLFLNTPIILAVPILAALGVAGLLVFLIVSYASPAEDN